MSQFPPQPVYPLALDNNYTLLLVFNTSEAPLTANNEAWADEVPIKPVAAEKPEVWATNGFANINGELFYYDAVDLDANGKVKTLKRCSRSLGGNKTLFNIKGEVVRGFVIAEHHNILTQAITQAEKFVGYNFTPERATLDWRIRNLNAIPIIFDDFGCPDINFTFNIVSSDPSEGTLANYTIQTTGNFTQFALSFGDGTSTTSTESGQHRYAPNAKIDPVVTFTNSRCTVVQTSISRTISDQPQSAIVNVPFVIPQLPPIIIPQFTVPTFVPVETDVTLPPNLFPCVDFGPLGITPVNIPSIILIEPPLNLPSLIDFGPLNIPSIITNIQISIPNIDVLIPSLPNINIFDDIPISVAIFDDIPISVAIFDDIPISITVFDDIPISITVLDDIPVDITVTDDIPIDITITDDIPIDITVTDDIPRDITVTDDIPRDITVTDDIPDLITIDGGVPDFIFVIDDLPNTIIVTDDIPITINVSDDIPLVISVTDDIPLTILVSDDIPNIINVLDDIPSVIDVTDDIPSHITIDPCNCPSVINFGPAPCIPVCWGTPPSITVTITCPSSPSTTTPMFGMNSVQGMAGMTDEMFSGPEDIEVSYDVSGFPSEIKVLPPEIPDVKVLHDLPAEISVIMPNIPPIEFLVPTIPDIKILAPEKPLTIMAEGIPDILTLELSENFPRFFELAMPLSMPSIKIDASDIPTMISVIGFPESISIEPIQIELKVPEYIPLSYTGGAIPISVAVQLDLNIQNMMDEHASNIQCVGIIACPK